jgi:hypothetical protein
MTEKHMAKDIKKYLRDIKKALPVSYKKRQEIMHHFSNGIYEYCFETENITIEQIYQEFGTVQEAVTSLVCEIPSEYITTHFQLKRFVTKFLVCVFICSTIILIWYTIQQKNFIKNMPTTIEIELKELPNK